jgi:hypothetical protein
MVRWKVIREELGPGCSSARDFRMTITPQAPCYRLISQLS